MYEVIDQMRGIEFQFHLRKLTGFQKIFPVSRSIKSLFKIKQKKLKINQCKKTSDYKFYSEIRKNEPLLC